MLYWGVLIYYKLKVQRSSPSLSVQSALRALILYPIVLLVTWVPNALILTTGEEKGSTSVRMLIINSLSIWQGGVTALIFIFNSKETRKQWQLLFGKLFPRSLGWIIPSRRLDSRTASNFSTTASSANISMSCQDFDSDPLNSDFEDDEVYFGQRPSVLEGRLTGFALGDIRNPLGSDSNVSTETSERESQAVL
jgi:hypothetical protein